MKPQGIVGAEERRLALLHHAPRMAVCTARPRGDAKSNTVEAGQSEG